MPDILYGNGAYRRDRGDFAELKLKNMFPEASPSAESGAALLSRPGLRLAYEVGEGPIRDHFQKPGLFNGDAFTVSGGELYRGTSLVGPIDGDGIPRWANSKMEVVVTCGQTAYSYREGDLAAIPMPDGFNVRSVCGTIGGMFIFLKDGSHHFYWSEVNNARSVLAISYAAAQSMPDDLLDCMSIGENLFLLGEESTETHYYDKNDVNLPLKRIIQRTAPKGIIATGTATMFDNALHWVGHDGVIYRMADVPTRMSNHALEERIAQSAHYRMFTFLFEGHSFLCVRLDGGTWVFDPAGGNEWPEFTTFNHGNFLGQCAAMLESGVQFGSDTDGKIYEFGDDWTDDGEKLIREFTAGFPIKGGSVPVDLLEIECNPGNIKADDWPGVIPQIEMRTSRDRGHNFSMWRTAPLGLEGQYRKRPRWRRLGYFDAPGCMIDFRLTDPTPLRVSGVLINEPAGGRARG
jgi:hypothetical protein